MKRDIITLERQVNFMKQDISKHVGKMIKKFRLQNKMTQKELGLRVGVKHNTISSYEKGTNEPEQDMLFKLAKTLNVSIDDLFPPINEDVNTYNQNALDNYYPYYPVSISAGLPIEVNGITDDHIETISMPNAIMGKWAGSKDIYMMRVNGESMNNTIPHNSLIAVKQVELTSLKDGDIVVYSDNHDYSVKRFIDDKQNKRFIFRPDSTDSSFTDHTVPYDEAKHLRLHGKVVLYIVELD